MTVARKTRPTITQRRPADSARRAGHRISIPPLISIVSPGEVAASGPHRKAITRATSSGVPARPSGIVFSAACEGVAAR